MIEDDKKIVLLKETGFLKRHSRCIGVLKKRGNSKRDAYQITMIFVHKVYKASKRAYETFQKIRRRGVYLSLFGGFRIQKINGT